MKATRKLIPAFAMLLIAAVMMSTATFAWFSTNATVTATGMSIKATSENTFVVIKTGDTKPQNSDFTSDNITADAGMNGAAVSLIPTAAEVDGSSLKWYKGKSTSSTVSRPEGENGYTETLIDGTIDGIYAVKKTFYVTVLEGFVDADNLVLSAIEVTGATVFDDAISVAIVATDGATGATKVAHVYNDKAADNTVLDASLKFGEITTLEVYVFINGRNSTVTSANTLLTGALDAMNITLTFATGTVE